MFISLVKDVPMIMSEIANVFKKNQAAVWWASGCGCQLESDLIKYPPDDSL